MQHQQGPPQRSAQFSNLSYSAPSNSYESNGALNRPMGEIVNSNVTNTFLFKSGDPFSFKTNAAPPLNSRAEPISLVSSSASISDEMPIGFTSGFNEAPSQGPSDEVPIQNPFDKMPNGYVPVFNETSVQNLDGGISNPGPFDEMPLDNSIDKIQIPGPSDEMPMECVPENNGMFISGPSDEIPMGCAPENNGMSIQNPNNEASTQNPNNGVPFNNSIDKVSISGPSDEIPMECALEIKGMPILGPSDEIPLDNSTDKVSISGPSDEIPMGCVPEVKGMPIQDPLDEMPLGNSIGKIQVPDSSNEIPMGCAPENKEMPIQNSINEVPLENPINGVSSDNSIDNVQIQSSNNGTSMKCTLSPSGASVNDSPERTHAALSQENSKEVSLTSLSGTTEPTPPFHKKISLDTSTTLTKSQQDVTASETLSEDVQKKSSEDTLSSSSASHQQSSVKGEEVVEEKKDEKKEKEEKKEEKLDHKSSAKLTKLQSLIEKQPTICDPHLDRHPVDYGFYRTSCKHGMKCRDTSNAHRFKYLHPNDLVCVPHKEGLDILRRYQERLLHYKANIDTLKLMLSEIMTKKNIPYKSIDLSGLERFFFDSRNREICENFLEKILPCVINCAINYFVILYPPVPLAPSGVNCKFVFKKKQALTILCNSFLCTFDDDLREKVKR